MADTNGNGNGTSALAQTDDHAIDVFSSIANFEAAQRMAKALAESSLVPEAYRKNVPNVLIAMDMASRLKASIFAVMQNLNVIHGNPSLGGKFIISQVNTCGRFDEMEFEYSGEEGTMDRACYAHAIRRKDGKHLIGTKITMVMAKEEGWLTKNGSKWKTMPDQMLVYRSAAFWTRKHAPELLLGMQTTEEVEDTRGEPLPDLPRGMVPGSPQTLEAELLGTPVRVAVEVERK